MDIWFACLDKYIWMPQDGVILLLNTLNPVCYVADVCHQVRGERIEHQSCWQVCLCAVQWNMDLTMSLISVEDNIHMASMWISLESGYVTAELYIDIIMPYYPSK